MRTKVLQAVALIAGVAAVSGAHAQIVNLSGYGYAQSNAIAFVQPTGGFNEDTDGGEIITIIDGETVGDSVNSSATGIVSVAVAGSFLPVDFPVSANAQANFTLFADSQAGFFSGSGSYAGSTAGVPPQAGDFLPNAGGNAGAHIGFLLTQPYRYELTLIVSNGTFGVTTFNFPEIHVSNQVQGMSIISRTGTLNENTPTGIDIDIGGCARNCLGAAEGSFSFTLQLTPVPIPPTLVLLGSAIGGLSILRRRTN